MASIIKQQQAIINSLRVYSQDLEDLYKSAIFKLQSLVAYNPETFSSFEDLHCDKTAQ